MALTRKFLSAMGIESDKVDEIINAHADTVDALKEERDAARKDAEKFKADAEKLPAVAKELAELKDAKDNNLFETKYNEIKDEYDKLKKEYDDYKADVDSKATKQAKLDAYKNLLKEAGVSEKRIDTVLKVSNETVDGIELDKDGKIKDASKLTENIKSEWADFIVTDSKQGADTPKPQENVGTDHARGESRAAKIAAQYHSNLYGESEKKEV